MACAYCYVPRRNGFSNPITLFANIDQICGYTARHVARQGVKAVPNSVDATAWVYNIGENSDCSVDARLSGNVRDLAVAPCRTAKASFAMKHVNRGLLAWDPQGRNQDPVLADAAQRFAAPRRAYRPGRRSDSRD